MVAERLGGLPVTPIDYDGVPRVTYSDPEVASVGITSATAAERGIETTEFTYDLAGNGKSQILQTQGAAKVIATAGGGPVLGIHLVGARVGELIAEAPADLQLGGGAVRRRPAHPPAPDPVGGDRRGAPGAGRQAAALPPMTEPSPCRACVAASRAQCVPAERGKNQRRSRGKHVGLRIHATARRERHRGHSHPLAEAGGRARRGRRAAARGLHGQGRHRDPLAGVGHPARHHGRRGRDGRRGRRARRHRRGGLRRRRSAAGPQAEQPAAQEQPAPGGDGQPGAGPAGDGAQEYDASGYQQPYAEQPTQQAAGYEAPPAYTQPPPGAEAPQMPSFPPAQQTPTQQYPTMPGGEQQAPAAQAPPAPAPEAPAPQAPAPRAPEAQPQVPQQAAPQPPAAPRPAPQAPAQPADAAPRKLPPRHPTAWAPTWARAPTARTSRRWSASWPPSTASTWPP